MGGYTARRGLTGWTGNVLHVDLTTGSHRIESPDEETYRLLIGGKALAGHYLFEFLASGGSREEMPLILMTGPLVATPAPTSGRSTFMSISPLTGAICDCSVGGGLGTGLKRTGLDGIVLTGVSPFPCGLRIAATGVEIVESETPGEDGIRPVMERLGADRAGVSVAATGAAAEAGVRFASIMVDGGYTAGRGGLGRVMAEKGVVWIRVSGADGSGVRVSDRRELAAASEEIMRLVASSPVLTGSHGISSYGTAALYDLMHNRRMMPTANFRRTRFESAPDMNACALAASRHPSAGGCTGCHIRCKRLNGGGRASGHLPEFETLSHFSALLENDDLETVVEANRICNELGMDTISAAGTLACHAELSDRRLRPHEIVSLLRSIAMGSDRLSRLMARGSAALADDAGRPELSMSVKSMELPAYDPRGAYGMALAYATSTRGGCHLRAYPISHEILRKPVATDRLSFDGKARIIRIAEDTNAVVDSLTVCRFVFFAATLEEYARVLLGVTGVRLSPEELLQRGERAYFRERMMNAMLGFRSTHDDLPPRFFEEEGSSGDGVTVRPIDRRDFIAARGRYYSVRGLDEDGIPTREKAVELNLSSDYQKMRSILDNARDDTLTDKAT